MTKTLKTLNGKEITEASRCCILLEEIEDGDKAMSLLTEGKIKAERFNSVEDLALSHTVEEAICSYLENESLRSDRSPHNQELQRLMTRVRDPIVKIMNTDGYVPIIDSNQVLFDTVQEFLEDLKLDESDD